MVVMKETPNIIWVVCYKQTTIRTPTTNKNCHLADSLRRPRALSEEGCRKPVRGICGDLLRNQLWQLFEEGCRKSVHGVFGDLWSDQLWQWLEEECRKPLLGVFRDL